MPTIRKRGDAWVLCWWEAGKEYRRSLGRIGKREAETLARLKRDELDRARHSNVVPLPIAASGMPTLKRFATDTYLPWHAAEFPHSHDRIDSIFELHLIPAFGDTALDCLTKTALETYKGRRKARAETVAKEMRALQACLNRAVFLEVITRNPVAGVAPPRSLDSKPPRWFDATELALIYEHSKVLAGDEAVKGLGVNSDIEDYAPAWRLLANTGLRRGEAQALKWSEITDAHLRVVSTSGERTKSGRWRAVPLSEGAQAASRS